MNRLLSLLVLLLVCASCTSPSARLRQMHADDTEGLKELGFLQGLQTQEGFEEENEFIEAREERLVKVRKYVAEGKLESAEDYYLAAALLAASAEVEDLVKAQECGFKAAQLGEARGSRAAAEAIDRYQMFTGKPQWYGTQVEFIEVLTKWRLYPVDPRVTDEQRGAMGVPPLAKLRASVDRINEKLHPKQTQ